MADKPDQTAQDNIFVARQPIFHTNQKIFGYELLFRNSLSNFFDPSVDGNQATSKVITNSFLLIGLRNLTGGKKAFINFTSDLLENEYPVLLPKDIIVVEVLEDVEAFVMGNAVGIERLGASRSNDPIAGISFRGQDEGGSDTAPIFQRSAFGNRFKDWDK